ncbi:MAG: type III-B CRISPR module-associated Cmr3 family protein [Motiliproteus sp.]
MSEVIGQELEQKTLIGRFGVHDSWFFRESRAHDSIGVSQLASLFPPPASTLAGAIKTWVGDQLGINWQAFSKADQSLQQDTGERFSACQVIGGHGQLGAIKLAGPWLLLQNQRYFPAPALLLGIMNNRALASLYRLAPGEPVRCDLGRVRLPALVASDVEGCKELSQFWISERGLSELLQGNTPSPGQLINLTDWIVEEPRLGIARDNERATVLEGKLYQTRHLRLEDGLAVECGISGLPNTLSQQLQEGNQLLRLGGEGRQAELSIHGDTLPLPALPKFSTGDGLVLVFLTAAYFDREGEATWLPDGFEPIISGKNCQVWRGTINGVELDIESAAMGKASREGGWDLQLNEPKPVRSLVAAGSCYFCRPVTVSVKDAAEALHGCTIGGEQSLGRGLITCGIWKTD